MTICGAYCWACLLNNHPRRPHAWADADDIELAELHDRPSPAGQPCPCPCNGADTEPKETPFDDEHRPAHAVFSWSSGLRYEEPCPDCHGRAGGHPCGCWGDTDTEYVCRECDQRGGSRRVAPYPCPTVTAITDALEER